MYFSQFFCLIQLKGNQNIRFWFVDLSSAPLPSDLSLHDLSLICSPTNKPQASSSPANTAAIKCNKPYKKQAKNKKRKPESVSKPSPVPTDTVPLVHTSQSKVNGHMTGHSSHLKRSSPHQYNYHSVFSADTPDRAQSINPSRSQIQAMVMSSLSHDEQISLGVSSSKVTSDSQTDDKVIFLPASLFCDSTVPGKFFYLYHQPHFVHVQSFISLFRVVTFG